MRPRRTRPPVGGPTASSAEDEVLALLHSAGLPRSDTGPTPEDSARADEVAADALSRIVAVPPDTAPADVATVAARLGEPGGRRRAPVRWRFVAGWAAVAAVAVVLVVTQFDPEPDDGPRATPGSPPPTATAAPEAGARTPALAQFTLAAYDGKGLHGRPADEALRDLAAAAAGQPGPGDAPVHRVVLDSWFLTQTEAEGAELVPTRTERYFLPDGTMRSLEYVGEPLDPTGRITATEPGADRLRSDETFPGPVEGPAYADSLPTDPGRLATALVPNERECPLVAPCLSTRFQDLVYTWSPTPQLVSALWRTLEGRPGVEFLGESSDRLDRPALGFVVGWSDQTRETVLYADPDTGALLGSETLLLAGAGTDAPEPVVEAFTTVESSGRVPVAAVPAPSP